MAVYNFHLYNQDIELTKDDLSYLRLFINRNILKGITVQEIAQIIGKNFNYSVLEKLISFNLLGSYIPEIDQTGPDAPIFINPFALFAICKFDYEKRCRDNNNFMESFLSHFKMTQKPRSLVVLHHKEFLDSPIPLFFSSFFSKDFSVDFEPIRGKRVGVEKPINGWEEKNKAFILLIEKEFSNTDACITRA